MFCNLPDFRIFSSRRLFNSSFLLQLLRIILTNISESIYSFLRRLQNSEVIPADVIKRYISTTLGSGHVVFTRPSRTSGSISTPTLTFLLWRIQNLSYINAPATREAGNGLQRFVLKPIHPLLANQPVVL